MSHDAIYQRAQQVSFLLKKKRSIKRAKCNIAISYKVYACPGLGGWLPEQPCILVYNPILNNIQENI